MYRLPGPAARPTPERGPEGTFAAEMATMVTGAGRAARAMMAAWLSVNGQVEVPDRDGSAFPRGAGAAAAVNNGGSGAHGVVVGISRSPASWWALAWAVGEARRRRARLVLVHVVRPRSASSLPGDDLDFPGFCRSPFADPVAYGHALIDAAVRHAVGQLPGDIEVERRVVPGRAAAELARCARGGDLLVLGSRHGLRRLAAGSVPQACARHAGCPVVIVPEPSHRALEASLAVSSPPERRFPRVPHRTGHGAAG